MSLALGVLVGCASPASADAPRDVRALILVYHRFGDRVADAMTVRTSTFESQLRLLREQGRPIVALRDVIGCLAGRAPCADRCSVVITADDGHRSIDSHMRPVVERFGVPVTLFVYPSAISNADYALTWDQLRRLAASGRFDVQSHSFWHPNFKVEKRRLAADEYRRFVRAQLEKPRAVLSRELGAEVDVLSWPFGIHDAELERIATEAGYVAAVTLEGRAVRAGDDRMALPRHLVSDEERGRTFARLVDEACR